MQFFIRFFDTFFDTCSVIPVLFGQSGIYIFKSTQYICSSPSWIFMSFPVGFVVSPVKNLLLDLTPDVFFFNFNLNLKKKSFPGDSISPLRRTESGDVNEGS